MALDMAKYQKLFLEEATEHLAEISSALLELEKDTRSVQSIDTIFRMAHSIKSMAASLGYESVSELAHVLEDRMETTRSAGCLSGPEELSLLFLGLEGLEAMVATVRETGEAPPPDTALHARLSAPVAAASPRVEPQPAAKPESVPLVADEDVPKKSLEPRAGGRPPPSRRLWPPRCASEPTPSIGSSVPWAR